MILQGSPTSLRVVHLEKQEIRKGGRKSAQVNKQLVEKVLGVLQRATKMQKGLENLT